MVHGVCLLQKDHAHVMHLHRQTFPQSQNRKWRKTELPLLLPLPLPEVSYQFREGLQAARLSESLRLLLYISVEISGNLPPLPDLPSPPADLLPCQK